MLEWGGVEEWGGVVFRGLILRVLPVLVVIRKDSESIGNNPESACWSGWSGVHVCIRMCVGVTVFGEGTDRIGNILEFCSCWRNTAIPDITPVDSASFTGSNRSTKMSPSIPPTHLQQCTPSTTHTGMGIYLCTAVCPPAVAVSSTNRSSAELHPKREACPYISRQSTYTFEF